MNSIDWKGVYPAVTTKFDADNGLDFDAMGQHLEFQLDAGVHGIIILGSLGENSTLSMSEKIQMVEFFADRINGRVPLLTCIAESGSREALELLSRATSVVLSIHSIIVPRRSPSSLKMGLAIIFIVRPPILNSVSCLSDRFLTKLA